MGEPFHPIDHVQGGGAKKIRLGIMKARIGSAHVVRGKDGKFFSVEVRDRALFESAKSHMVCLARDCRGKSWPTFAALVKEHDSHETMVTEGKAHPVAMWSDAPLAEGDATPIGLMSDER